MVRRTFCDICNKEIKFPLSNFSLRIELNTPIEIYIETLKFSRPQICESCKDQIINYVNTMKKEQSK